MEGMSSPCLPFPNLGLILISFYSISEKLIDYVVLVNIRILLV